MPGIQALLQTLRVKKEKDVAIVFSCLNDRDVDEMIDEMLKAGYPVYVTTFQDERAIDLSTIEPRPQLTIVKSYIEAMQTAYIKKTAYCGNGVIAFYLESEKISD